MSMLLLMLMGSMYDLPPVHLEPLVGGGRRPFNDPGPLWPKVDTYRPKRPRTDEDRRRIAAAEAKRERKNQRRQEVKRG